MATVYEEELEEYFFHLQLSGCAKDTILRRFSAISSFYKHIIEQGWITENPIQILRKGHYDKKFIIEDNILTNKQLKQLRKVFDRRPNIQRIAYFELILSSGIRSQCLPDITWNQVDFDNNRIINVREKRDKVITVYFSERTKKYLLKLKELDEHQYEYVFKTYLRGSQQKKYGVKYFKLNSDMQKAYIDYYSECLGLDFLSTFNIRATGARLLVKNGMKKKDVSLLFNHKTDAGSFLYKNFNIETLLEKKREVEQKIEGRL